MKIKNCSILDLLREINNRCNLSNTGILNSESNKKIMEYLEYNPDAQIGLALTFGKPTVMTEKNHKCSRCGKMKSSEHYQYYLSRIDSDGYLLRTNAICDECRNEMNKSRHRTMSQEIKAGKIGEKPKSGDVCPSCNREWTGKWHRHHDSKSSKFKGWICSQCNMSLHDQRKLSNPDKILSGVGV